MRKLISDLSLFLITPSFLIFLHSSAAAKISEIDVQKSGDCIWDGEHDVSPCIQTAINGAALDKGIVRIPRGEWPLLKSLSLADNITIEGDGHKTILRPSPDNTSPQALLMSAVGSHNVLIQNLTFDGGGPDYPNKSPLIEFNGVNHVVFNNIIVRNSHGIGLVIQGGTKFSGIRNSLFINLGNHWKSTKKKEDRIQGVVFCCGIGNENNFAIGNRFEEIGLDSLQIGDQHGFNAEQNSFDLEGYELTQIKAPDYPAAIFAINSYGVDINRNKIQNAPGNGIDAPGLQYSTISYNSVSGCGGAGIGLFLGYDKITQSHDVLIDENIIHNNAQWNKSTFVGGITVSGGSPYNIMISGNKITDTQRFKTQAYGIQVRDVTSASAIHADQSNQLTGNRVAGSVGRE